MIFNLSCQAGNILVPVKLAWDDEESRFNVFFPYNAVLVAEIKAMEGAKWHPEAKHWSVLGTKRNLFAFDILSNGPGVQRYDAPYSMSHLDGFWKHQDDIYNFIKARRRCIIAGEMRTGKTRPTIRFIEDSGYVVIWFVSTKSAIMGVSNEMLKWGTRKHYELMTYQGFKTRMVMGSDVPECIVFDEAQALKSPGSQRSEEALDCVNKMEAKHRGEEAVILLSGTPAPKDPSDWWHLCEVARPGFLRESSKEDLKYRCGNFTEVDSLGGSKFWQLTPTDRWPTGWRQDEVDCLYRRMNGLVKVYLKKNVLDLPPIIYDEVVLVPAKQTIRVANALYSGAETALVGTEYMSQLSDGFIYQFEYTSLGTKRPAGVEWVGSPKEARIRADLQEYDSEGRIVIYAAYSASVDRICQIANEEGWLVLRADGRGWELMFPPNYVWDYPGCSESLEDWKKLALREMDRSTRTANIEKLAFVGQADAAGTGIELSASSIIIYYSNSRKGESRMQSEARAHSANMDKEKGLIVRDYLHLPVDVKRLEGLKMKKDLQAISMGDIDAVLDAWKEKGIEPKEE